MNKELIINASGEGVEIALLEDKKLVELHYERGTNQFAVGDLYLGRIKKLMPQLNAVFVDVGYEKDAFLSYTDLSPYLRSLIKFSKQSVDGNPSWGEHFGSFKNEAEILKNGKITEVFNGKPEVLVQVFKEPISSKGPRLSCEISLPGRFVVVTPFNDVVAISRKIHSADERKRLQRIVESIKPKNFGVIVRTAAEGKNTAELHADILELEKMWKTIQRNLKGAKAPQMILSEQDKTTSILRDLLSVSFQKVVINDKKIMTEMKDYISRIAPEQAEIVSLHTAQQPIFETYGISKQVKAAFGKTVNLSSGAYLIIEHTEALHVIDVNSGTRHAEAGQEQNAIMTNLEAAAEIARQMRLRDLGGIIIIDFIDMKLPEHKKQLVEAMEELMVTDRAKHTVLPISKFGLMQITRQRLRPELNISTAENCPTCKGTGKIGPSILLADDIEKDFKYLVTQGHKDLALHVHPIVEGYLTKGTLLKPSIVKKWAKAAKVKMKVVIDNASPLTEYNFYDAHTNDMIKL
ncbi:ribonuclease E/G [Flavipsychrobacter stenotrophus]|uniref:Ribonuclease E/G n=1 Tax=Flavipsychrobacter stenotrophus TaxID=2077091 RepID=A0A2S7SZC6_9BACT|nr:Rne/Rng family ribonuclease [Flavipsychrobacter stenotrophus]PQJ12064.1 ribonuclease E/G [Flavipsychrobacter stenotrophus]